MVMEDITHSLSKTSGRDVGDIASYGFHENPIQPSKEQLPVKAKKGCMARRYPSLLPLPIDR